MSDAIDLIRQFCDEFGKGASVDEIVAYFTDDATYHNIPSSPRSAPRRSRQCSRCHDRRRAHRVRVLNIVGEGNVVLTERVDVFVLPNVTIELPVMGTFEVRDGKIAKWRDYFDLNQYMSQLA